MSFESVYGTHAFNEMAGDEMERDARLARIRREQMSSVLVKWVSVKDEYPEYSRPVLLALEGKSTAVHGYGDGRGWFYSTRVAIISAAVTHWAEMPMTPNPERTVL